MFGGFRPPRISWEPPTCRDSGSADFFLGCWQGNIGSMMLLEDCVAFSLFFLGGGEVMVAACFQGSEKILRGVFCSIFGTRHTHTHTTVRISERTAVVGWLCLSIYERLIWNTCFSCLFWVKRLHFYHYNRFHVLWCSMRIWQSVFIVYIVNSAGFLDPCHLSCKNTNHIRDLNLVKGAIISAAGMVGNDRNWSHLPEATLIAGCSIPQFLERTWWVLCHWSGTNKYLNSRT